MDAASEDRLCRYPGTGPDNIISRYFYLPPMRFSTVFIITYVALHGHKILIHAGQGIHFDGSSDFKSLPVLRKIIFMLVSRRRSSRHLMSRRLAESVLRAAFC